MLGVPNMVKIFFVIYRCFESDIRGSFGAVGNLFPPESVVRFLTDFGQIKFTFFKKGWIVYVKLLKKIAKIGDCAIITFIKKRAVHSRVGTLHNAACITFDPLNNIQE